MRRSLLIGFLFFALMMTGLASLDGAFLALALPFGVYLYFGLWRAPADLDLRVSRQIDIERAPLETPATVTLTVTNRGGRLEEATLEDLIYPELKVVSGEPRRLLALAPGETFTWSYKVTGPRGYYPFPEVRIIANDYFNLVRRVTTVKTPGQLFILPPVLRLKNVTIRPRQTRVYSGTIPARVGGPGVEFFGVREYQPGDPPHWINWHASARHEQAVFSNEYEQERVADVGLIVDGRQRTDLRRTSHSLFEHTVTAAAALADAFIASGNRVGMLVYGEFLHWTFPGYGRVQRERILQALARARTGESQVFADLGNIPTRLFPAHSQLVLVSPVVDDDVETLVRLRSRGYQVMLISPDPVAYELSGLPETETIRTAARIVRLERKVLLNRLRRAGVQVVDWDVSQPLDRVVKARLGRPPGWLRTLGS
ncbi:MAG: DUF58 domain-containing protein [Chloroflexota bacterium]